MADGLVGSAPVSAQALGRRSNGRAVGAVISFFYNESGNGMNEHQSMNAKPLIAIVDDDNSLLESTRLLLCTAGYRTEGFASAREFLVASRTEESACLILDVRMPEMDGLELQRLLNEARRQIPIIFITAEATENEERRARQAGAVDFLRKPVDADQLLKAIRTALKEK
jgi:FixJ family two-component response regulator